MSKEIIQSNIDFFKNRAAYHIDEAINFAKCNLVESARAFFDIALSYQNCLRDLEKQLEEIKEIEEKKLRKQFKKQANKN